MDYSLFRPSQNIEDNRPTGFAGLMGAYLFSPLSQAYSDLTTHPFETYAGVYDRLLQNQPKRGK